MNAARIAPVLFLPLLFLLALADSAVAADFQIIAHPDVPVDAVGLEDLGRIFTRDVTEWPDGSRIVPVEQGGAGGARDAFYKATLNTYVEDITAFWIRQAMSTGAKPPRIFSHPDLVVNFVAKTPGAIGFIAPDVRLGGTVKRLRIK